MTTIGDINWSKLYEVLCSLEPFHWAIICAYSLLAIFIWYFLFKFDK